MLLGAAWLAATVAIGIAVFSIYLTVLLQWDGAFRDLWEFVDDIERQFRGEWSLDYLLEAYGGAHRIFLPKLVFFADFYWLGGRNWLTIAVALLCQCAYLWLIMRALSQQVLLSSERIIVTAGFVLALFSTTQVSNFLYAMDVQWYMSNLLGLVSLYYLSRPAGQQHWPLIIGAGTAAALCNFTGLMALPVAMLVVLLVQPRQRAAQLLLMAAICVLYVHHEKNENQIVLSALRQSDNLLTSAYILADTLGKMAPYLLRYLASPLSREWPLTGSVLSITGLATLLYYWLRHYRDSCQHCRPLSSWQKLCLYIATYIAASAVFTAFGRIIYPNSAVAERYQTLVLPWLPALFGLVWPDVRRHSRWILVWLVIFGCYLLPTQPTSARDMAILSHRVHLAHTAARAGVLEPPYISASLSHPLIKNNINSVKDNDAFLREHGLGYFRYLPEFALDQHPATNHSLPGCEGFATRQFDDKTNSWLFDGQLLTDGKPVIDIALLQDGKVVGLGRLLRPEGFLRPLGEQPAHSSRFRALARQDRLHAGQPLLILGINSHHAVCQFVLP